MSTAFNFAIAIILVPSAPALKDKGVSDQTAIQGTWEVTGCTVYGHKMPEELLGQIAVTFRGDKFQLTPMPTPVIVPGGPVVFGFTPDPNSYRVSLDEKSSPKSINSEPMIGEDQHLQGIYRIGSDRLVICFSWGFRPKQFESSETDHSWLYELRRTKR